MNSPVLPSALLALELAFAPAASRQAPDALDTAFSTKQLGCVLGERETTFRVFAPRATAVTLVLFDRYDDERGVERPMARDADGVWETVEPGRLAGRYYGFRVAGSSGAAEMFDPSVVVADPYSRAVVTKNEWRHPAKSLVLDTSYDWEGDTFVIPSDHNRLVIYEAHLRDLTAHPSSGVRARGTYHGLVEPGRRGGLAYLERLGVNAVELLPLQDFGNFELPYRDPSVQAAGYPVNTWNPYARNHWGYMTSYFFAPESYYASDGTAEPGRYNGADGRAVREMKDMVKALHARGIAVIMDVVYNHVSNYDRNPLKYIDKAYYFRLNADGSFRSDSGCGNDLATERPMARRLIVDSIKYWMTEYHVDGFRFDLAAMIDWETCRQIADEARKINPNVVLIAEPWGGGKYDPAGFSRIGWAAWNDRIRNGVKGRNPHGPVPPDGPGFIFGAREGSNTRRSVESYVTGTLVDDGGLFVRTEHSINYLESHDDNTLGDYVRMVTGSVKYGEPVASALAVARLTPRQLAVNKLAAAFLLTSQGPVMIAEGQEFARSKVIAKTAAPDPKVGRIDDNSYEKDNATNYLDYRHAELNRDLVEYYAGLVALRRANPAFGSAPRSAVAFVETGSERAIAYALEANDGSRFFVALNGDPDRRLSLELPPGRWAVVANARRVSPTRSLGARSGRALVPPTSALVLRRVHRR
jgi:pullulanase/glycogen debranching enzyme